MDVSNGGAERIVGAVPVLAMPFDDDGAIDEASLRRELDFCIEAGSQAIAFGMGSESAMLTDAERAQAWSLAARHLDGRLPLIAGHCTCQSGGHHRADPARAGVRCYLRDGQSGALWRRAASWTVS